MKTAGMHHITAISGDAQRTLDFYGEVLGLRFVKKTVNFDDPYTYHLYFGDTVGTPGTVLTFFPWTADAPAGHAGVGQPESLAFAVPEGALEFWQDRLNRFGIPAGPFSHRFGERVLEFADFDGLRLAFIETTAGGGKPWTQQIPIEHAILGFHSVTLLEAAEGPTADLLQDSLGLREEAREPGRIRYSTGGSAGRVDVALDPVGGAGAGGRGTIHHVAFRVADLEHQRHMRQELVRAGHQVTQVIDRQYFRSVYFHEPGGVLLELATDGPGFTVDETLNELGSSLRLPLWYEKERAAIEGSLSPLVHPAAVGVRS